MQPRSAAFDEAVIHGGRPIVQADLYRVNLATGVPEAVALDVAVLDPRVAVDGEAAVRRTFAALVVDHDGTLRALQPSDPLAPYGVEAHVFSGFLLDSGVAELLPVGVFRITRTTSASAPLIAITGSDRSVAVAAARFEAPYVIPAGTNLATAIHDLIDSRYPGLTYTLATTAATVGLTVYQEGSTSGDPWENARSLAKAGGMEVFFDVTGGVTLRAVPDPTTDPLVWSYAPGSDNLMIGSEYELDGTTARNVAVVRGEGAGIEPPITATAEITDPASPLYPLTLGRRPVFLVSQLITTQAQADAAALALLQREAGGSEQAGFRAAPHPAHEAGDVVRVMDAELGYDVLVVLASWTFDPTLLSEVTYTTRARRSAA